MWLSALEIGGTLRYNRSCLWTETLSSIGRRKSYLITTFDTDKFNPFTAKWSQRQISSKFANFIL